MSPTSDYSVVLPTGWTNRADLASQNGADTAYLGPAANGFATNLNVVREATPSGTTAEQYRVAATAQLRSKLKIDSLSSPSDSAVDGTPARVQTFSDQQSGRTLRQGQIYVVHGTYVYVLTYTALPAAYTAGASQVNAIVASWQWGSS